jgi:glycosyltransferase involved in cell wall biosynthesis
MYTGAEMIDRIGREAYSYHFVSRAFAPLLARWGKTFEITQAESRLDYALWKARQQNLEPIHLSFLPLHLTYLTQQAPNVVFPFWEFPDLPDRNFGHNPRNNWGRVADHLSLLLTASTFTRDTFVRAGVKTPVQVVPVPIPEAYFDVAAWEPRQRAVIDCPCYVFPPLEVPPAPGPSPWLPVKWSSLSLRARLRNVYKSYIFPKMPAKLDQYLTVAIRTVAAVRQARLDDIRVPYSESPALDLSGIVYTTILNPFDPRKNWQDLFSAFLLALGDREDATLVVKLVVCPKLAAPAVNGMLQHYQQLGIRHRCKLVFVTAYLSDTQMLELAQASTYYVNTARAEGACLPLQNFLAARRPGIAPVHTAMTDYFGEDFGFVVTSDLEPASWPHDPEQRLTTRWHRLVWQSLFEQLQASYELAKENQSRYQALGRRGRECMAGFASAKQVWPRLEAALNSVTTSNHKAAEQASWRIAS